MTPLALAPRGAFCCRSLAEGIQCWPKGREVLRSNNATHQPTRETEMPAIRMRLGLLSTALTIALASTPAFAQKGKYDIGATDTEIKIGNIMPYSGPASAYG